MFVPETEIIITKDGTQLACARVKPGDYVIGSSESADIVVVADDISGRHAMLTVNYHEIFIEDLGSGSTSVGGSSVTGCTRVWPNQKVQIGSAVLSTHRIREPGDTDMSLAPETEMLRQLLPKEFLREKKYEIGGLVGTSEMGDIVDAMEATTGRTVAMKVMLSSLSEDKILNFIGEAQITSQLEHPNIIPVHDLGIDEEDHVFYTTKLVQGVTLRRILKRIAAGDEETIVSYPLARLLTIFQKICDGVAYAHSKSVVHEDLKPANVTIGEFGEVLVMNWGHAKRISPPELKADLVKPSASSNESGQEEVASTPSPASEIVDRREDIYALGAILYQILALRAPSTDGPIEPLDVSHESTIGFRRGSNPTGVAGSHLPDGRIPASLAAVAMKALSDDPRFQYASVPELQADIAAYQNGFPTSAERANLVKQLVLLVRRHKREAAVLAAIAGALVVLGLSDYVYTAWKRNLALREGRRADEQRIEADRQRIEAASERERADAERKRAERTFSVLRSAAPAYQRQAGALVQARKYSEALESIGFAIALAPNESSYHLERANMLQAMQRLAEAADSYRRVLELAPANAPAKANLELCETLLAESAGNPLTHSQQTRLLDAIAAQKRSADVVYLSGVLGSEADAQLAGIKSRLADLTQQPKWTDARLRRQSDGTIELNLSELTIPDLAILRGLPISTLNIARTGAWELNALSGLPLVSLDCSENPISDLYPLQGRPLRQLAIDSTGVTDLLPLKGMLLRSLSLSHTAVVDLEMLRGMPLETLCAAGLPITSIDVLRGMPLQRLDLYDCRQVTDFSVLATFSSLKALNVPAHFGDLGLIQKLRSLERLGSGDFGAGPGSFDKMPTVATFLNAYGRRLSMQRNLAPRLAQLRETLKKFGMSEDGVAKVALGSDGFLELDLSGVPIDSLMSLAGLPVRRLVIKGTKISDLTPLGGMPLLSLDASNSMVENLTPLAACPSLTALDVSRTRVSDLRALSGLKLNRLTISGTAVRDLAPLSLMPLRSLYFDETKVEDLRPLARCTTLESVTISRTSRDANPLRKLPWLARISYSWDYGYAQPAQSASEFWEEYESTAVSREGDARMNAALAKLRLLGGWSDDRCEKQPDGTYKLNLSEMKLEHLRDIADCPISILNINETNLTRIGPIANCPIRELSAVGCSITDLSLLGRLPLVKLELTQDGPSDLRHLRGLKLRELILHLKPGPPINPDLSSLKGMPLEKFAAYGFVQIASLKALEGAPLTDLRVPGSSVSDLKPLRGMPLTHLDVGATRVTDISPVRESPLTRIDLRRTSVRDVSPLADCKALESIILPRDAKGIEKLRTLTNLKKIAFEWTSDEDNTPALSADQFWAEFDTQKKR